MPHFPFLRPMIYSIAALIAALLTATMLYNSWMLYTLNIEEKNKDIYQLTYQDGQLIAGHLAVYQTFLEHWATQDALHVLLILNNPQDIQQWQETMLPLVPNALSLHLLDPQGQIIVKGTNGHSEAPCEADIKKILNPHDSSVQPMPACLHTASHNGEKHIDLYAHVTRQAAPPLRQADEKLGFLLLRVRLSLLNKTLKKLALVRQNQLYARLLDSRQQQIWELNDSLSSSSQGGFNAHEQWHTVLRLPVYPTSWTLDISRARNTDDNLVIILLISLVIGFALIIGVAWVTQQILTKDYSSDFAAVTGLLNHLAESRPMEDFSMVPRLQETAKMFAAIRPNAEKIQQAHQKLEHLSRTDELTHIPNRRAYREELQRAMHSAQAGVTVCLVLLDLDGFKLLNDTAGHQMGDEILKLLAATLTEHCGPKDHCARLGGDEFTAILFGMDEESVSQWIERVRSCFMHSQQQQFAQYTQCTTSAGFTFIRGGDVEENAERAFRRADHALYDAKKAGKNTFCQG